MPSSGFRYQRLSPIPTSLPATPVLSLFSRGGFADKLNCGSMGFQYVIFNWEVYLAHNPKSSVSTPRTSANSSMGRRKISIELIPDARSRQTTFLKRKTGLMKKAMELAVLCNCRIGLIIFDANGKLYDFKSEDMSSLVTNYFSQEVIESNDKNSLFRKYNGCKDDVKSELATSQDETLDNSESAIEDGDKTDETVVEMDSGMSDSARGINRKRLAPALAKIAKRKSVRRPHEIKYEDAIMARPSGPMRTASQSCNDGWSTFSAHPAYIPESVFAGAANPSQVWDRGYKNEPPFSTPQQQQILRLEDSPPFLMRIPCSSNEAATYGMSSSSVMPTDHRQRQSLYQEQQPNQRPDCSTSNGAIYLLGEPDNRKIMDSRDGYKNPTLPPMSSSLLSLPGLSPSATPGDLSGQSSFPFYDPIVDPRHVPSLQQFSLGHGLSTTPLADVQQESLLLQRGLCSNTVPPFPFPSASHTPPS